jgi:hypothetical protein
MVRKREIPPHPKRVVFVPKDPKELEPALVAAVSYEFVADYLRQTFQRYNVQARF